MSTIPQSIQLTFVLATLLTLWFFLLAVRNAADAKVRSRTRKVGMILILWLLVQAIISYQGLYVHSMNQLPPGIIVFGVLPCVIAIALMFLTPTGRAFTDNLSVLHLTWLNVVRVPVELVLYGLFLNTAVPELMTFAGRNFDILCGITAPLLIVLGKREIIGRRVMLFWNIAGLMLLLNIMVNAALSAPTPLQQFGFEQPNIAIFYLPFSFLPAFVAPMVLYGHLVSIRRLLNLKPSAEQK